MLQESPATFVAIFGHGFLFEANVYRLRQALAMGPPFHKLGCYKDNSSQRQSLKWARRIST
jgi:hypothetical protein